MDGPRVDATSDTSILIDGPNRVAWSQTLHFSDSEAAFTPNIWSALILVHVWLTLPARLWALQLRTR